MTTHHTQLLIDAAKVLNLNITTYEDEFGNTIIKDTEKIDLFNSYKQLISEQIELKKKIIASWFPFFLNRKYKLLEHKIELLKLSTEYLSKKDWIEEYTRHSEYHKNQVKLQLENEKVQMPELVRKAHEFLGWDTDVITKEKAILTGLLANYYRKGKSDNERLTLFTQLFNQIEICENFKKQTA